MKVPDCDVCKYLSMIPETHGKFCPKCGIKVDCPGAENYDDDENISKLTFSINGEFSNDKIVLSNDDYHNNYYDNEFIKKIEYDLYITDIGINLNKNRNEDRCNMNNTCKIYSKRFLLEKYFTHGLTNDILEKLRMKINLHGPNDVGKIKTKCNVYKLFKMASKFTIITPNTIEAYLEYAEHRRLYESLENK